MKPWKVSSATEKQAIQDADNAEEAHQRWHDSTPFERRMILNQDELVGAIVCETGAKPSWAAFNNKTTITVHHGRGWYSDAD